MTTHTNINPVWGPDETARDQRRDQLIAEYTAKGIPFVTAFVMAGDEARAEYWEARAKAGENTPEEAINLTGSYARLNLALRMVEQGLVERQWLLDNLPELWRGSDPDDSDPRFLELWKEAWRRNGRRYLRDGRPLPRGKWLTVYRGQAEAAAVAHRYGIAWSLDPKIARKFAATLGGRQTVEGGVVVVGQVLRAVVLGYLTERGESEVVVDPVMVQPNHAVRS